MNWSTGWRGVQVISGRQSSRSEQCRQRLSLGAAGIWSWRSRSRIRVAAARVREIRSCVIGISWRRRSAAEVQAADRDLVTGLGKADCLPGDLQVGRAVWTVRADLVLDGKRRRPGDLNKVAHAVQAVAGAVHGQGPDRCQVAAPPDARKIDDPVGQFSPGPCRCCRTRWPRCGSRRPGARSRRHAPGPTAGRWAPGPRRRPETRRGLLRP